MPLERFKVVPSVYIILIKNNKILLGRRYNTGFCDGQYGLPSGHLEGNENLKQAMTREAKEEIGIILESSDLELVHTMSRKSTDYERVDFFFTTKKWRGEPKIMELEKCDELNWFDLNNLLDNTIEYVVRAIKSFLSGVSYSECGW